VSTHSSRGKDQEIFMEEGFSKIEQEAWGGFLSAYARIYRLVEADLLEHSRITHVEFEVLLRLSWEEGHRLRIQDLAARSILTRSGVSRVVERLEKAGLVRREGAVEDRRGAWAVLTEAGVERFRTAAQAHIDFVRRNFLDLFNDEELKQMAAFWMRLEGREAEDKRPRPTRSIPHGLTHGTTSTC
jgi:DNA-binding MarR family transcriptional regulator